MKRVMPALVYAPAVLLWLAVALPYALRAPDNAYTHDFQDHLQYSQLMHQLQRLPLPREGGETHQPPLYYLIISHLNFSTPHHVRSVRLFSVFLGALSLLLIQRTLARCGLPTPAALLALAFCATTPHFLFLFSSYNNDALVIFLGIALWAYFIRYVEKPTLFQAVLLGIITLAGFFTKYSFGAVGVSVGMAAVYLRWRGRLSPRDFNRWMLLQAAAFPFILAWMYFHNYQSSGAWMALNDLRVPWQRLPHSPLATIFMPPGFAHWEWATPFADAFLPAGKKSSLTAYAFVSSIFGEYSLQHVRDGLIWFIFWVHVVWWVSALREIPRTEWGKVMGVAVGAGWLSLAGYVLCVPYGSAMDFRHVAWLWLPLTTLGALAAQRALTAQGTRRVLFLAAILLGVLAQWTLNAAL